jgi:integration host factor subunit beta
MREGTSLTTTTKRDLAEAVAEVTGTTKLTALHMVDNLFETMRELLSDGQRIEIRGFGAFSVKATKPKPAARNPKTGEIVYVPARRKTQFRPGKVLLEAMHVSRE